MNKTIKRFLTVSLFLSAYSFCNAFTNVPAGNVSGHWTVSGSPYQIQGNVTVPNGTTLTIDPGVTVLFENGPYTMEVKGRVLAIGTAGKYIYFTAANHVTGFSGIRFDTLASTNDTSKFIYCNLQYGADNVNYINGGAFEMSSWNKVLISNSTITKCQATNGGYGGQGGAIFCNAAGPLITNDSIYNNNSGGNGGGIYLGNDTNAVIENCYIYNNNNNGAQGGGIYGYSVVNLTVNNNTITYNSASTSGGGIGVLYGTTVAINGNNISHNTIPNNAYGGGVYLGYVTGCVMNNNTITYNTVPNGGNGGGVSLDANNVLSSFSYNNISYNSTGGGTGGGLWCANAAITNMAYDTIANNSSSDDGGGIWMYSSESSYLVGTMSNCVIVNNSADLVVTDYGGGGIYCYGESPAILNVTISGNTAQQGGGICFDATSKPSFYNCILWGDSSTTTGMGNEFYQNDANSAPNFYYSDVYGGKAGFVFASTYTYKGTYAANNINKNPEFVSPSGGFGYLNDGMSVNWGIQKTSPCFNTGDPSYGPGYPTKDLAGATRVTVCRIDMGAYENQYAQPLTLNVTTVNTVCGAVNTGEASLQVTGGSSPITYVWTGGSTKDTIKNLAAGNYTVTVTEGTGCTSKITAVVDANPTMTATFTQTPPPCNGGSGGTAAIQVSNGTTPYSYSWSSSPIQTTDTAKGLYGITYTCTVTDKNGCQITPTVTVNQPTAVVLTKSRTDASCSNNDGIAGISATGGIKPYTYMWSSGSTTSSAMGLAAGNYTVTVKDSNLCTSMDTINIRVNSASSEKSVQICFVSVDTGSNFNIITWNRTGLARIDSFKIYFYNSANQWQKIGEQPFDSASFSDHTPINNPNNNTVRYCVTGVDSCGNEEPIGVSPWQNTCHIIQSPPGTFSWSGTGYLKQGITEPVGTYYLTRDSLSNNHWRTIDSISGTQNTMTDGAFVANPTPYNLSRWRVVMKLSDSVNTGCSVPDFLEGDRPLIANVTTSRSNTQHNTIYTGINSVTKTNVVSVYPNPATDEVTVSFSNPENGILTVNNVLGQTVYSSEMKSNSSKLMIDISSLPQGLYLIQVTTTKQKQVLRFIKQ